MKINPQLQELSDCLYRLSVKALIVRDGKALLTMEDDDDWWSLPGGGIDYGEEAQEALVRELSEEIGVSQSALSLDRYVTNVIIGFPIDGVPRANLVYRVNLTDDIDPAIDSEPLMSKWFSPGEIAKLHTSPSTGSAEQLAQSVESEIAKMTGRDSGK